MIALWMLYVLVTSGLLAVAARAVEASIRAVGRGTRWIWVLALVGSGLLPIVAMTTGGRLAGGLLTFGGIGEVAGARPLESVLQVAGASSAPGPLQLRDQLGLADGWLLVTWLLFSIVVAATYVMTWLRLRGARQKCTPVVVDGERVLLSSTWGPAAVGMRSPAVVIPEWLLAESEEVRRLVLLHEREHVRAGDHSLLALAPLIAIMMPWNIVTWWQLRRLRLAIEVDCDGRVLAGGIEARQYGSLLIDVAARARPGVFAPAMAASRSSLEHRIVAMTSSSPRMPAIRRAASIIAGIGCVVLACDAPSPAALDEARSTGEVASIVNALSEIGGAQYELDGEPVSVSAIRDLAPESIYSVEVVKRVESGATEVVSGVVRITTRSWAAARGLPDHPRRPPRSELAAPLDLPADALFEVDGRRVARAVALALAPESIDRVEVIKRRTLGPGDERAASLVRITTKSAS